jgi:hypothetical protein
MQPEQVIVPPDTVRDDDRASCGRVNRNTQVTAQVPPGTVRDDGERALAQALADQVLDSIRVAPRVGV